MTFWEKINEMNMDEYKPGILSRAEFGEGLTMACMNIDSEMTDPGHTHPFDQCGIVLQGMIEMVVEDDKKILQEMDTYFIPSDIFHGWRTFDSPVLLLDVSSTPR